MQGATKEKRAGTQSIRNTGVQHSKAKLLAGEDKKGPSLNLQFSLSWRGPDLTWTGECTVRRIV